MEHLITNGNAMAPYGANPLRVVVLSGLALLWAGCSGAPPAGGDSAPEPRTQKVAPLRDREGELTTLRGELAATRIAAAKKEAELLELRDLVRQLRLENAESRQAFLDLRDRSEQRQTDIEKGRDDQERQTQSHTTQRLTALNETVATLAQELGHLKQELARQVASESPKFSKTISSNPGESRSSDVQSSPLQRVPSTRQDSPPPSAPSPVALTVTSTGMTGPVSTITVQSGDTLGHIAIRAHTSVSRLREMNQLKNDVLEVGQVLVVPPSPSPLPK